LHQFHEITFTVHTFETPIFNKTNLKVKFNNIILATSVFMDEMSIYSNVHVYESTTANIATAQELVSIGFTTGNVIDDHRTSLSNDR
jgi:CRISPR/Cas system-associated protein endoribonuclease Cas2